MDLLTAADWADFIAKYPKAHLLQTSAWGDLKSEFGWTPKYLHQDGVGAMALFRRLPFGFTVAYIPRGPVGADDWSTFWPAVDELCKRERAVFLRVEPDIWQPVAPTWIQNNLSEFVESVQTIQPPRTVLISLEASEDELLAAMKPKTRYNIRLAARKDVIIRPSTDIAAFHQMILTTAERDAFGVHSRAYYQRAFDLFASQGACVLLMAEYEQQPLAGIMVFAQGETAWYFYGASTNHERNRMPTYLLQWEAMCWAKQKGCRCYDLWGVPDYPESVLEEAFTERSDGLWGVYRFKRGFGGGVRRTIGAWDRVYMPLLYRLYQLYTQRRRTPAT